MERVTGLEPANTSLGSLYTTWFSASQISRLTSLLTFTDFHSTKNTGRNTGKLGAFSNRPILRQSNTKAAVTGDFRSKTMERATGIEPASRAWEARVITIIRRPHENEL